MFFLSSATAGQHGGESRSVELLETLQTFVAKQSDDPHPVPEVCVGLQCSCPRIIAQKTINNSSRKVVEYFEKYLSLAEAGGFSRMK